MNFIKLVASLGVLVLCMVVAACGYTPKSESQAAQNCSISPSDYQGVARYDGTNQTISCGDALLIVGSLTDKAFVVRKARMVDGLQITVAQDGRLELLKETKEWITVKAGVADIFLSSIMIRFHLPGGEEVTFRVYSSPSQPGRMIGLRIPTP